MKKLIIILVLFPVFTFAQVNFNLENEVNNYLSKSKEDLIVELISVNERVIELKEIIKVKNDTILARDQIIEERNNTIEERNRRIKELDLELMNTLDQLKLRDQQLLDMGEQLEACLKPDEQFMQWYHFYGNIGYGTGLNIETGVLLGGWYNFYGIGNFRYMWYDKKHNFFGYGGISFFY